MKSVPTKDECLLLRHIYKVWPQTVPITEEYVLTRLKPGIERIWGKPLSVRIEVVLTFANAPYAVKAAQAKVKAKAKSKEQVTLTAAEFAGLTGTRMRADGVPNTNEAN